VFARLILVIEYSPPSRRLSAAPSWARRVRQRRHPAGPRGRSFQHRRQQREQATELANGHAGPPQQLTGRSLLQPCRQIVRELERQIQQAM
jgi:hypothetical protein